MVSNLVPLKPLPKEPPTSNTNASPTMKIQTTIVKSSALSTSPSPPTSATAPSMSMTSTASMPGITDVAELTERFADAAWAGDLARIRSMLERFDRPKFINSYNSKGRTTPFTF